ncbi:hypothetical protein [Niveibacterium sp.]|uniref:hypothetical protein n=1 Tax=Niveibacterium sp. TaxID=2017444 RepID=UPI0035AF985D
MRPLVLLLAAAALVVLVTALLARAAYRTEAFTVERAAWLIGNPAIHDGTPHTEEA